ncbi:MAG: response regulator [Methanocalculus sp.]|uniref:response regulator n=1 Tax=Methanocalculus sp. TaxID=2004547 RepID=UPI00271AA869|nr:response regulator [Methanocalculus sp.]MDO9539191.1 response regulator [Methanocalculus sp.]
MSRILVVDDEAIITMQLEERLGELGYTVVGMAASGEEAIERARTSRPDLILMDIVMPGKLNGVDAAEVITQELDIPVIFVTSYADDTILEKAKTVRPYGYIIKPFNELELKAAIEVALFRKAKEREEQELRESAQHTQVAGTDLGSLTQDGISYLNLPEIKTVLLKDIFTDIVLFLYTDQVVKEPIFKFALEQGIKNGGRNLFAYSQSTVQKYFLKEIQRQELYTHRIKKNEVFSLMPILVKCTDSLMYDVSVKSLQILLDFSGTEDFDEILAIRDLLLFKKEAGMHISGIIALNIERMDHTLLQSLSEGISKIIVSTGKDTTLSFAHQTFPVESVSIVSQSTIDSVIKKSLEPVVLSLLSKPISGYDIVHEIKNRYNVFIPQARVYTLLHELMDNGYLEIRTSGKSKLYCTTELGKKHISQKLDDFKNVFDHIMGSGSDIMNKDHKKI